MNAIRSRSPIPHGMWQIDSVLFNSDLTKTRDFQTLETAPARIAIRPIGVELIVQQAHQQGVILRSENDLYFGDVNRLGNQIVLHLTRPAHGDSVSIEATFIDQR